MKHVIKKLKDGILFGAFKLGPNEYRAHAFLSDMERREVDRVAVYIEGSLDIIRDETNEVVATRLRGEVNSEVGKPIKAGKYRLVAGDEGGRYLCFFPTQQGTPFEHRAIRLKKGESYSAIQGRILFLRLGKIEVNGAECDPYWSAKVKSDSAKIVSKDDETLLMEMWR